MRESKIGLKNDTHKWSRPRVKNKNDVSPPTRSGDTLVTLTLVWCYNCTNLLCRQQDMTLVTQVLNRSRSCPSYHSRCLTSFHRARLEYRCVFRTVLTVPRNNKASKTRCSPCSWSYLHRGFPPHLRHRVSWRPYSHSPPSIPAAAQLLQSFLPSTILTQRKPPRSTVASFHWTHLFPCILNPYPG